MQRFPRFGRAAHAAAAVLLLAGCADQMPTGSDAAPRADLAGPRANLSATPAGHIRIGVVPTSNAVSLGGTGDFVIRDKATGAALLSGSATTATVTLESVAVIKTYYRAQVVCAGSTFDIPAWVAKVEAAGYEPYTEFVPSANCTRLRVGRITAAEYANASFRAAWLAEVIAKGLSPSGRGFWTSFTETEGESRFKVALGGETAMASNPVMVEATSGYVVVGTLPYRGTGDVVVNSRGTLAGVNQVRLEEYLYGVLPRELPPTVWPEAEAQKAQAVAARTYALRGMGKRKSDGYDLLPTTSDQVYSGVSVEHPISTQAVDATAGVVATYNGALIEALFSSTTGGHTSSNEEIYNSDPVAYLRGVPDAQRGQAFDHVPSLEVFKRHANPKSLRAEKDGDFEANWSRYHRWVIDWTLDEITDVVDDFAGKPVGRVTAINVVERGPSGRATRIEYVTEDTVLVDTKDRIRSSLKYFNASGTKSSLLSTLFYIEPVSDPRTKQLVGFKAYGGGWGHGIGLSQTGAVGMAEKGRTYEEILKHYYQGITLETR